MPTVNLGIVRAIHIGTTSPSNTQMLWYDTNPGVNIHKYYNVVSGQWVPLAEETQRKAAVIDYVDITAAPPTEVTGDRYILDTTAGTIDAGWDGANRNDIVEFNGSVWVAQTPEEGWIAFVDLQDTDYQFIDDGSPQWTPAGGSANDRVKVSSNDTTEGYLEDKLIVSHGTNTANPLELTTLNDGGDEDRQLQFDEAKVDHDNLLNYDTNQHVDHTTISINTAANSGLTGGGTIAASRSLEVDISNATDKAIPVSTDEVLIWDTGLKKADLASLANAVLPNQAGQSGKVLQTDGSNTSWAVASATDEKVSVSVNDTTPGYLEDKFTVSHGTNTTNPLELTTLNDGGDEDRQLQFDETKVNHGNLSNRIITGHTGTAYRLILVNSGGNVSELVHGTSGYVLKSNGPSADPSWQIDTAGTDELVKVSSNDTTAGYFEDKFVVSHGTNTTNPLELTTLNDGGDEDRQLQFDETKVDHDNLTNKIITGHTGTAYRTLYIDSGGDVQELTHGTAGQVLTSNGASANPSWAVSDFVGQQVYYVGKHGNDSDSGKSYDEAFLTFGAAITAAAGQTPSSSNIFTIVCEDSGIYDEALTMADYINIYAPNTVLDPAAASTAITLSANSTVQFKEINPASGQNGVNMPDESGTSNVIFERMALAGASKGVVNSSVTNGGVLILRFKQIFVDTGVGIADASGGTAHIHAIGEDIYIQGNSGVGIQKLSTGKIVGRISHILELGSPTTTIGIDVDAGEIDINIHNITADTVYDIASGATLSMFINSYSGATTVVGTENVTVAGVAGGATPAGANYQLQYYDNSNLGANINLAWDTSNLSLNLGQPSATTGRLNLKGKGNTSSTSWVRTTDSANNILFEGYDDGVLKIAETASTPTQETGFWLLYPDGTNINVIRDDGEDFYLNVDRIENQRDVSLSGRSSGDILVDNGSDVFENVASEDLDTDIYLPFSNISANGQLSSDLFAKYRIESIFIKETASNSAGNVSIGFASGTNEIVEAEPIGADFSDLVPMKVITIDDTNDRNLYISSSAWGSGVINVIMKLTLTQE